MRDRWNPQQPRLLIHPQRQEPSRSMRNISQHMLSPSSDSMRGNVHRLTEAARGTEASPLPSRVISHPSSTSSPSLNVNPDARVLQDRTSWQSRPYTFPPSPHSLFSLSGTTSMDHSYRRYQCECGSNSNARQNSSGPNDAGPPSQASEAILSITPFDRASSAGILTSTYLSHPLLNDALFLLQNRLDYRRPPRVYRSAAIPCSSLSNAYCLPKVGGNHCTPCQRIRPLG